VLTPQKVSNYDSKEDNNKPAWVKFYIHYAGGWLGRYGGNFVCLKEASARMIIILRKR